MLKNRDIRFPVGASLDPCDGAMPPVRASHIPALIHVQFHLGNRQ